MGRAEHATTRRKYTARFTAQSVRGDGATRPRAAYSEQLSPHTEPASLTQIESQLVLQQYESTEQIFVTHGSQPDLSFAPVKHSECAHVPAPVLVHVCLHTLVTSPTQMLSHAVVQQYASTAQTSVAHGSQLAVSAAPAEQIA